VRILVTNDDGVEAPGLRALARALVEAGHDVTVVAPDGEHSGAGASIGRLHRSGPIGRMTVEWPELPGVPVHALATTPAAAVYAGGLGSFGPRPELVASGVNRGLNTGHLALHSGTVGAALTGLVLGLAGIAVSLGWGETEHWSTAAALAAAAVPAAAALEGRILSLNVPNVPVDELAGVRAAEPAPYAEWWHAETPPGELRLVYDGHVREFAAETDVGLVEAGFAAVTELSGIGGTPAFDAAALVQDRWPAAPATF
jgi:5'-nucleotidase